MTCEEGNQHQVRLGKDSADQGSYLVKAHIVPLVWGSGGAGIVQIMSHW